MINAKGDIVSPVDASDPYRKLEVNPYLATFDVGYMCSNQHGKINMAARYKPVRSATLSHNSNLYKGDEGDCGINISGLFISNPASLVWYYKPPILGTNLQRLSDFNGYDHNAKMPFVTIWPELFYTSGFTCVLRKSLNIGITRNGMLNTDDLVVRYGSTGAIKVSDMYLALVINEPGKPPSSMMGITSSTTIGLSASNATQDILVRLPPTVLVLSKRYDFYLVLCPTKHETYQSFGGLYPSLFSLDYSYRGISLVTNVAYKLNQQPVEATHPILKSIAWLNPSITGSTFYIDGFTFNFDPYGPDIILEYDNVEVIIEGSNMPDGMESYVFYLSRAKGQSVVNEEFNVQFRFTNSGPVSVTVNHMDWDYNIIQTISQTLNI